MPMFLIGDAEVHESSPLLPPKSNKVTVLVQNELKSKFAQFLFKQFPPVRVFRHNQINNIQGGSDQAGFGFPGKFLDNIVEGIMFQDLLHPPQIDRFDRINPLSGEQGAKIGVRKLLPLAPLPLRIG